MREGEWTDKKKIFFCGSWIIPSCRSAKDNTIEIKRRKNNGQEILSQ